MHLPWCIKGNRHRGRCLNTGNRIPGDWSWASVFSCPVNTARIYTSHGHCLFFSSPCERRVALARLGEGSFCSPKESRERASVPFLVMTLLHFSWMSIVMGVHCLRDLYPPFSAFRSSPNCSSAPTGSIMNTLHSIVSTSFKPQICLDGLGCCPKTGLSHACIKKTRGGTFPVVQW